MIIPFNQCQITVSGVPLMVDSASLSISRTNSMLLGLGYKHDLGLAIDNNRQASLTLSYYHEVNRNPLFTGIKMILNNNQGNLGNAIPIIVGNISGEFFITRYDIDVSENTQGKSILDKVSLVSFKGISGFFTGLAPLSYNMANGNNLGNFFTSQLLFDDQLSNIKEVYGFTYSCALNWQPVMVVGSIYPSQVLFTNGTEETKVHILTNYSALHFTGSKAINLFNVNEIKLRIRPLEYLWDNTSSTYHEITTIGSGYIGDADIGLNIDDNVAVDLTINREF